MWIIRTILILLLLLMVVAFAFNNTGTDQKVAVHLQPLFPNYVDVPLITVVFWSFVAGALMCLVLFISTFVKLSIQSHAARKRIKALESEVAILRNRPIDESADLLKGLDRKREERESPFADR
ncbi:MAG: LapA family protein [Candidatus Zixiibacteriota bacterium]